MDNLIAPEKLESWRKAGRIAATALKYGSSLIKKGAEMREVLDKIEEKIKELGAEPSFPAQISCDEIAAHFCPTEEDKVIFENQVASLDVGVHIDGCQGDNACTVDLSGKYSDLVKASREAVENAVREIQIGVRLSKIGKIIEDVIKSYGFEPIRNLSGHGMSEYEIHTQPTVPNYDTKSPIVFEKGMIIAIEPFATTGVGFIYEKGVATVFSQIKNSGARGPYAKEILRILQPLNGLPFTTRWLTRKLGLAKVRMGMNELIRMEIVHQYPPLVERSNGICSQAEHTVYVGDKAEVLTRVE